MAEVQTKFNQLIHNAEIYIETGDGDRYEINPNAIVNLNIEDSLANWIVQGTLSFFYNPETDTGAIDRRSGNDREAATGLTSQGTKTINFRNDGTDYLYIHIIPKSGTTNEDLVNGTSVPSFDIEGNSLFWSFTHKFSIYEMEDIDLPPGAQNAASSVIKCYKLYFWDYWYQKLITNVIEYSTGESELADPQSDIAKGYEHPGTIPTGMAMKEILEKAVDDIKLGEGEEWEEGATRIFYTAPAQWTAYDDLEYVYNQHISNKSSGNAHDQSLLIKEKGPEFKDTGYLTLRPISYFYDKAGSGSNSPGEYQIEHFFLQSYSGSDSSTGRPTKTYKAPLAQNSTSNTVDIKTLKYHQISNYRFVDVASITNSKEFVNHPVYSVNLKDREIKVEFQSNKVQDAKKFIADNYISKLYKNGSPEELFLIHLNEDKENKIVKPVFSLFRDDPIGRQAVGLQKLLYIGLYHNACINFRTLGLTYREPGRFIAIDKTAGVEPGDFENKFFGQWFVINVKHIFEAEMYYNDITAVKVHRFEPLK